MNARAPHRPTAIDAHASRPEEAAAHLTQAAWADANRALVRKAIAEFAHEALLAPEAMEPMAGRPGWQRFRLAAPHGTVYRFAARLMALRHWHIDTLSIERETDGLAQPLDALAFIIEFKDALGIAPELLPIYLDEISSTLYGAAYKRGASRPDSEALVDADFQTLEAAMSEGHPGFVANNGRLGFDANDYRAYAPEAGTPFRLVWLAVSRSRAHFASVPGLSYERLMEEELGPDTVLAFRRRIAQGGRDPDAYLFMPCHPWQWCNKLAIAFAAEIAEGHILCLGESADRYRAQQSIRTYFNTDRPARRYVKTSLSILNMGFMRGLSPHYMAGTPAINAWIRGLAEGDATLRELGFSILEEVASIGYRQRHYEAAIAGDSPYKKMLSCLWRESPVPRLAPGERLMTMAALLHVDARGRALLPRLIRRSGLGVQAWLRRYLRAYLAPLLHCFYAHDLSFMPHGENLILVLRDHVPARAIMKDIGEESAILDKDAVLPAEIGRLAVDVPEDYKLLAIFIDVFDGVFRHLSALLAEHGCCTEEGFWSLVAECAVDYQARHPALREKFARYDLFAPSFRHSCLNRLQLANTLQMVNLANPAASLRITGTLPNPLAPFKPWAAELAASARAAAQGAV